MIGQQRVRMDGHLETCGRLAQPAMESLVIRVLAKHQLAVIAALQNMMRLSGNDEARQSCHETVPPLSGRIVDGSAHNE